MDISGYLALPRCSCDMSGCSTSYPPLRYYELQYMLEDVFGDLSGNDQKQGAAIVFSHLSAWLWKEHFEKKTSISMKAFVKTIDDVYTSMCELERPLDGEEAEPLGPTPRLSRQDSLISE